MNRFKVEIGGKDSLGLRQLCESHANTLWVPDHLTAEQACWFVLDHFRRSVLQELEQMEVRCVR